MFIDTAKVEGFKNWFFGRPNFMLEDDEAFSDLPVHVATEADLPKDGDPDAKYFVAETGDTYRYRDGAYYVIDVYSYGCTNEYREAPRRVVCREVITDYSYTLGSITADQIRAGTSPVLATLYNIQALLIDLAQIRRMYVTGYRTTLMEVLSKGPHVDKDQNLTTWFSSNHSLLYRLLASSQRSKDSFNTSVVDALHKQGYVLTWDDDKNRAVFKVDDFIVYL